MFWLCLQGIACATPLLLDDVLQKAVTRSYSLKMADVDIRLGKVDMKAARGAYLPDLKANLNVEYLKDLEKQTSPVTSVGNNIIPSGTRFQNSAGFSLNHTLVDFGVRRHRLEMAKKEVLSKAASYEQTCRDLKIKLVDLYEDALIHYKTLQSHQAVFEMAQQIYQLKKRLYQAGSISKVEMTNQAIELAQVIDDIQTSRVALQEKLQELGYFTQDTYDLDEIELVDFEEPSFKIQVFHAEMTADAKALDFAIAQKEQEIAVLKRQNLPQVMLYSYYNFYGFDPSRLKKSIDNFSQRTISLGLSVSLPILDGLKNNTAIERAELEKEKLGWQKAEKLAQLTHQAQQYEAKVQGFTVQLGTKARILKRAQYKQELLLRLSEQQMIEQSQLLQENMGALKKQLDADKIRIQSVAALKKRQILEEG